MKYISFRKIENSSEVEMEYVNQSKDGKIEKLLENWIP